MMQFRILIPLKIARNPPSSPKLACGSYSGASCHCARSKLVLGSEFRVHAAGWGDRPEPPEGGTPNGGSVKMRPSYSPITPRAKAVSRATLATAVHDAGAWSACIKLGGRLEDFARATHGGVTSEPLSGRNQSSRNFLPLRGLNKG